jgi:hypothetical protein
VDIHNLPTWVQVLDERLAEVLASRLFKGLENWNYTFGTIVENGEDEEKQQKTALICCHSNPAYFHRDIATKSTTARSLFFDRLHDPAPQKWLLRNI